MRHSILITDAIPSDVLSFYEQDSHLKLTVLKKKLSQQDLKLELKNHSAVLIRTATKLTAEILHKTSIKAIGRAGVGVDNIDLHVASKHHIPVFNAPNGNTVSAAEYTLALILASARWIPQAHIDLTQNHSWDRKKWQGIELFNKKLGIIGFGRIGQAVAKRALGFGMKILVYDPLLTPKAASDIPHQKVDLKTCLGDSDFLTLHVPLTEQTQNLLNSSNIKLIKTGARLINASRGEVVNEKALIEALQSGKIAVAALDVYNKEPPLDPPSALLQLPNCICLPHLGAATADARSRVAREAMESVIHYLDTRDFSQAVNAKDLSSKFID